MFRVNISNIFHLLLFDIITAETNEFPFKTYWLCHAPPV